MLHPAAGKVNDCHRSSDWSVYLLDTNVVSELRRPRPHGGVVEWIQGTPSESLFVSAVTIGEIQAGIEKTREQDAAKAQELTSWLDRLGASYGVLEMDARIFREWARLKHGKSDSITLGRNDCCDSKSS